MVVGLSLPFGVGDVVSLSGTADERRLELVGKNGTVTAVRPGDRRVMAIVAFDGNPEETTLVYGTDDVVLVERYRHGLD